jgi:hypothetical protein
MTFSSQAGIIFSHGAAFHVYFMGVVDQAVKVTFFMRQRGQLTQGRQPKDLPRYRRA